MTTTLGRPAGMKTCDDCQEEYAGPAYYTFLPTECVTSDHDGPARAHLGCTGNLCPRCAGPDLEPDRPDDPRRLLSSRAPHEFRASLAINVYGVICECGKHEAHAVHHKARPT